MGDSSPKNKERYCIDLAYPTPDKQITFHVFRSM